VSQKAGLVDSILIDDFLQKIYSGNTKESLQIISSSYQEGVNLTQFTKELISTIHEQLIQNAYDSNNSEAEKCLHLIEVFEDALQGQRTAHIATLPLEMAVLRASGLSASSPSSKESVKHNPSAEPALKKEPVKPSSVSTPESAMPATPTPAPEPQNIEESVEEITIESIKARYLNIVEKIKDPVSKMSYREATPVSLENSIITLEFKSNFALTKASSLPALTEAKEAMYSTFRKTLDIKFIMD
jgi:DNA polymerase III gamma/tau subunit